MNKSDESKVWTVEKYYDKVIERNKSRVRADVIQFATQLEALQFCVDRSRELAHTADLEADKADQRHRKCWKRFKKAKEAVGQ